MTDVMLLGRRAVREVVRYPEATIPTLFIPLFFLAVNIGQVSRTFPSSTPFLMGQGYVAFQLPVSLMFGVATASSGLALVTEIDLGYFDKLLVAPIPRSSIVLGRLAADFVRGIGASVIVLLAGLAFGAGIQSGVLGAVVIVLLAALFGVAYAGFGMVALRSRNVQATQSSFLLFFPLLFLTPNFVPFNRLSPLMETLAHVNPVSYVIVGLRALVINGWDAGEIAVCLLVILGLGGIQRASAGVRRLAAAGHGLQRHLDHAHAHVGAKRRGVDGEVVEARVVDVDVVELPEVVGVGAVKRAKRALGCIAVDLAHPHGVFNAPVLGTAETNTENLRIVAQRGAGAAAEDHPASGGRLRQQGVAGRLVEVRRSDAVGRQRRRRAGVGADEARQQPLEQAAGARGRRLLVGQRLANRDLEPLGDGERDAAIDERDPEPLGQRRADLAAVGAVGGRQRDDRHGGGCEGGMGTINLRATDTRRCGR
jgi:ABC-2 type transport system permease protein